MATLHLNNIDEADLLEDIKDVDEHAERYGLSTHKTPEERQEALKNALIVDPGVERWSWRAFQMYFIVLVTCFCSGDNGLDGTVMGGINSMKQYQTYFGMSSSGATTGIVFGIFTVGSLCGVIPTAILPDKFGRRFSMLVGSTIVIGGAILTGLSKNRGMFIGGRFLTGMGSALATASAKSFLGEITPPHTRGLFLGFWNSFYYVGQIIATGMMVATGKYQSEWAWRLPLFVQIVPAALNVVCVFLVPESPRWLFSRGEKDLARQILANLHSRTGDARSPLVELEMEELKERIQSDGSDKRWWDFRPLFRTSADRYRSGMVILMGSFGQLSGNGLITFFLPVLLQNAGITDQNRRLTLNFVNSITSYIGALVGSATVDRAGRRAVLLSSTCLLVVILAIVSGLLSKTGNAERSNAGISFIYLFMVVYSFGWTPMQGVYSAEVLSYEVRAKGLAFLNLVTQAASCINTFALPVALQRIGWKVYLVFLFWDVFEVIVIYFFLVETKNLTLEEIDEVFAQPSPRKYSVEHRFQLKSTRGEAKV